MESRKKITNVVFKDIRIGDTAEMTVTLKQSQIDVAAMVSGDLDAFYVKGKNIEDSRPDPGKAEAAGAEALVSILLGTRLPGPGTKILHRNLSFDGDFAVGDTLTAKATVLEKHADGHQVLLDCRCTSQSGLQLVSGTVRVEAPTARLTFENFSPPKIELRWGDPIAKLIQSCRGFDPIPCAVVHPCSEDSLMGAVEAAQEGLILPVLVGPEDRIRKVAEASKIDLTSYRIVSTAHSHASAEKGVELARAGEVEALMKGSLHSDEFMGAIVSSSAGLRTSRRISHATIMAVPTYPKAFIITDAAVNISPTLEVKIDIVQNAIDLARVLGVESPKVAILSAVETVNPRIPSTLDAAALCKMADRGQVTGGILDGPLAFDNAISAQAAEIKGIRSPVSGDADILLAPDLEAGNMLFKQLAYLAGAEGAGIVLGTRIPVVLTSRADSVRARLASIAVMARVAHARRSGKFEKR